MNYYKKYEENVDDQLNLSQSVQISSYTLDGEHNLKNCEQCYKNSKRFGKLFQMPMIKNDKGDLIFNFNFKHDLLNELLHKLLNLRKSQLLKCNGHDYIKKHKVCNQQYFIDQNNYIYNVHFCQFHKQDQSRCAACRYLKKIESNYCIKCQTHKLDLISKLNHIRNCLICGIKYCSYTNQYLSILPQNSCEGQVQGCGAMKNQRKLIKIHYLIVYIAVVVIISVDLKRLTLENLLITVFANLLVVLVTSQCYDITSQNALIFISTFQVPFIKIPQWHYPTQQYLFGDYFLLVIKILLHILYIYSTNQMVYFRNFKYNSILTIIKLSFRYNRLYQIFVLSLGLLCVSEIENGIFWGI